MKIISFIGVVLCLFPIVFGDDVKHKEVGDKKMEAEAGSSSENPIPVKGIKNEDDLDQWFLEYVEKNYPSYQLVIQETDLLGDGIFIEVLHLENGKGDRLARYFDTSQYMADAGKKHQKELKKLSKKLKLFKPVEKTNWPEGTSYSNPVLLKNAITAEQVDALQTKYLQTNYPGYEVYNRLLLMIGNRFINRLSLKKEDDSQVIMFDVSDYMKEYGKTHSIELREMSPFAKKVEKSPL